GRVLADRDPVRAGGAVPAAAQRHRRRRGRAGTAEAPAPAAVPRGRYRSRQRRRGRWGCGPAAALRSVQATTTDGAVRAATGFLIRPARAVRRRDGGRARGADVLPAG